MLTSFGKRAAMAFTGAHIRSTRPASFARLMSSDASAAGEAKAEESGKEAEKPKRVSMMPDLKTRLEQDRIYKEVIDEV